MRLLFSLILLLQACSHTSDLTKVQAKPMDEFYQGAGIEKYFMADVPMWINFSSPGQCRREYPIRYLDYYKLNGSYGFSYEVITQMQIMLNRRYQSYVYSAKLSGLQPKDEAFLFHTVMDQVEGGARELISPKQKDINLIWIDGFFRTPESARKFQKFAESDAAHSAIPVWVSLCFSEKEIAELAKKYKIEFPVGRIISAEAFTPFDAEFKLSHDFSLDFSQLFPEANLKMYFLDERMPVVFKGINKNQKIE
jgi:hypothetical protein